MAREAIDFRKIQDREEALRKWLGDNAPKCFSEQKHLEEGSTERVYWHYGYMVALRDVVRLLTVQDSNSITSHNADMPNTNPPV
jgi:hypothetical protein